MDSCWKNTPSEIIQLILRFTCSRLVYREGKYIEIGKIKKNDFDNINDFIKSKLKVYESISRVINDDRWYFVIGFKGVLVSKEHGYIIQHSHGLTFDFNWYESGTFYICYWSTRDDVDNYPYSVCIKTII